jgi:hypothetical protein
MFQTKNKEASKRLAALILALLFCVVPGCVSPEAIKTDIHGIRNDMGRLEKLVDQKADNTVIAEQVDEINNKIEQTTQLAEKLSVWRKNIQAETINYSGAGWVMASVSIVVLIFVGAGLLFIKAFMGRGNLLTMLTGAIKKVGKDSPHIVMSIKKQLKCSVKDGHFYEQDRKNLGNFARKKGTFVE